MGGMKINICLPGSEEPKDPNSDDKMLERKGLQEQLLSIEKMLSGQKSVEQNIDELKRGDTGQPVPTEELHNRVNRLRDGQEK